MMKKGLALLLVLAVMITTFSFSSVSVQAVTGVSVVKINDQVIDTQGHNFSSGKYGLYINSAIHAQDMMVTHNNYQYAVYYSKESNGKSYVNLARRKLSPKSGWSVITFTDYNFTSNDTHNTAVIGISRADGTIHLAFDHHNNDLHYRVSQRGVANNPESVVWSTNLFGPVTSQLIPGQTETKVTYPRFIDVPNGNLQFIRRSGGSGDGDTILYTYNGNSTHSWKKNGIIISSEGNYNGSTSRNAYLDRPQYFNNKLYLTWVWREAPDAMTNHDIMFAYSEDYGATWKNNSGTVVATTESDPMKVSTAGLKVRTINQNHGLMNHGYSYVDDKGRVHVVTSHAPEGNPNYSTWELARADAKYTHYWRGTDKVWRKNVMNSVPLGSRSQIVFDSNNTGLMIFNQGNRVKIAAATEANNWNDWGLIYTNNAMYSQSPSLDFQRWKTEGILSLLTQEIPATTGAASEIHEYDFRIE
ncbi:Dockerin type 1 [Paenibacillus algicola]|uniref:Dockerin type 1 n=1 Tax=Paenibacillus algicola TaxID=2565926 RepID=A0A4V1G4A8_9BACL|nr:BNR repeat-containing protein [Paenibacillus algicola]QCT04044.1 Dockerin type 1 [Paenibacillus algicola]